MNCQCFENRVILVTGASRGIGAAIADEFASLGAYVVGTATTVKGAEAISSRLKDQGIKGEGIQLDITDSSMVKTMLEHMKNTCGMPDVLVNNAGINRDNLLMRMSDEEWDDVLLTDLTSVFKVTKACLRAMMKKRWGRVISIGSLAGCAGNPGQANYSAAKAGLIGFSKSLAKEVASRNITVNVVAPGLIETDMAHALTEQQKETILSHVPIGRMGQAKEIAAAVVFLASNGASYITGNTIQANGGMYMQ